ncbi:MAG: DNA translocase FtsK 4TM domain-containing protein, partial [Verrucomicrobiota bacterium]
MSLLLLLSLVSYSPKDWPNTVSTVNPPVSNFIGPVGAWLAYWAFQILGVAAYFLMLVLAVIGVLLLLQHEVPWRGKFCAGLLLLLSASCLLHIAGLRGVVTALSLPDSAGGYVGLFVGDASQHTVGKPGTFIIFFVCYIISLILLINFRPSYWVKLAVTSCRDLWASLRGKPRRDVLQELSEKERDIRVKEYDVGREVARKEKEAKKLESENKPVVPLPEPKISDYTVPRPAEPVKEKKPKYEPVAIVPPVAPVAPVSPKPKRDKPVEVEKGVLSGAMAADGEQFVLPPLDLLEQPPAPESRNIVDDLKASAKILKDTVREFDIDVESGDVTKGPTVTLFELHPAAGVRVEKISTLSNNIAMAMRAEKVRILAPVPGKGTVGVEVPNISRTTVYLRDMLESPEWQNHKGGIPIALGRDVKGHPIIGDLAQMPHLLIAGATGSGKTVCVNAILASLLYRYTAEDLRLVLIDPKMVEMQHYNALPHLVVPVVTEAKKVPLALGWVIREMEKRFQIFAKSGVRNITAFNARDKKPT